MIVYVSIGNSDDKLIRPTEDVDLLSLLVNEGEQRG